MLGRQPSVRADELAVLLATQAPSEVPTEVIRIVALELDGLAKDYRSQARFVECNVPEWQDVHRLLLQKERLYRWLSEVLHKAVDVRERAEAKRR